MMSLNYLLKVEISPGRISLDTNPSRSGLYIRVYEIDEDFSLWIGGGSPIGRPMYIRLKCNDVDVYADVTKDDIAAFIEKQTECLGDGSICGIRFLLIYINVRVCVSRHLQHQCNRRNVCFKSSGIMLLPN